MAGCAANTAANPAHEGHPLGKAATFCCESVPFVLLEEYQVNPFSNNDAINILCSADAKVFWIPHSCSLLFVWTGNHDLWYSTLLC